MGKIFHITTKEKWKNAKKEGTYSSTTLVSQGFIHCSTKDQVIEIANCLFKDVLNVIILEIIEEKIKGKIVYENFEGKKELFPHIYGKIELDTVNTIYELQKDDNGEYYFPYH